MKLAIALLLSFSTVHASELDRVLTVLKSDMLWDVQAHTDFGHYWQYLNSPFTRKYEARYGVKLNFRQLERDLYYGTVCQPKPGQKYVLTPSCLALWTARNKSK